jgi:hypothetical protein
MIEEIVIAHHTPFTPILEARKIARGIRNVLKTMLTMAGGEVFPTPLNIPCMVNSVIMNI